MPAEVTVLVGPARSGRTHRFVTEYRGALRSATGPGVASTLWLAPSSRSVATVREQLLADGLTAVLDPGILTFDHLANRVFAALPQPPKVLSPVEQRELLRRVVERLRTNQQLSLFAVAAERASFIELLVDMISELTRHGITAATFAKSIGSRGDRAQHEELSRVYTEYEALLKSHHLCDGEGRHVVVRDAFRSDQFPLANELRLVVADGFTDFTCIQHEILAGLAQRAERLLISLPGDESLAALRQSPIRRSKQRPIRQVGNDVGRVAPIPSTAQSRAHVNETTEMARTRPPGKQHLSPAAGSGHTIASRS